MTLQATRTHILPATNTRPTRIRARCTRGSIVVPYDHEFTLDQNHCNAANALFQRFKGEDMYHLADQLHGQGKPFAEIQETADKAAKESVWNFPFSSGQLPDGSFVHVFHRPPTMTPKEKLDKLHQLANEFQSDAPEIAAILLSLLGCVYGHNVEGLQAFLHVATNAAYHQLTKE